MIFIVCWVFLLVYTYGGSIVFLYLVFNLKAWIHAFKKRRSIDPCQGCAMKLNTFVVENRNQLTIMECIMINIFDLWFGTSNKILVYMPSSLIGTVDWDPSLGTKFSPAPLHSGDPCGNGICIVDLQLFVHVKVWQWFFHFRKTTGTTAGFKFLIAKVSYWLVLIKN